MSQNDQYEEWRRTRAADTPPEGFAEGVMAAVQRHERNRAFVLLALCRRVAASRGGQIVLWSTAVLACLAKAAVPVAMVLVP